MLCVGQPFIWKTGACIEGMKGLPFALMSAIVSLAPAKAVGLATGFF